MGKQLSIYPRKNRANDERAYIGDLPVGQQRIAVSPEPHELVHDAYPVVVPSEWADSIVLEPSANGKSRLTRIRHEGRYRQGV